MIALTTTDSKRMATPHQDAGLTIPADMVLLQGASVGNEAMLTGESVPQRKESIHALEPTRGGTNEFRLELENSHHKTDK